MSLKIGKCGLFDNDYPYLLKEIHKPPRCLYYLGDISAVNLSYCISIVGSRNHSDEAILLIRNLIEFLSDRKLIIVSGLANGIDALVHRECLNRSIRTLAVMPLGLENITPKSNLRLFWDILENGGLCIAEDKRVVNYNKYMFPRRNRIIAGLSMVTIVIEAGIKSGAVTTADLAFRENRNVFAFPGSYFSPFSKGTNKLIMDNVAKILIDFNEILSEYNQNHED